MECEPRIIEGNDWWIVKNICRTCGSESVKKGYEYLRVANYHSKEKCLAYLFDDVGFYFGIRCRKHFRLIEFAVKKTYQNKKLGRRMFEHLSQTATAAGLEKITLRTSMYEPAINFWEKMGGCVIGVKGNDYEVEIMLKRTNQ